MSAIKNRYEFAILFDVENGNPNGDPDAGNMPRMDIETSTGIVTNNCLKRKLRNYVEIVKENAPGYGIYINALHTLNSCDQQALSACGIDIPDGEKKSDKKNLGDALKEAKKNDPDLEKKLRNYMCENFYDIRTFGAVMTTFTKGAMSGQLTGPVQLSDARSIDPIWPQEMAITRVAVTTEADRENKRNEMGRKYVVPYALYLCKGYVCANLARKATGFSEEDLELLWEAIMNMFVHDHSAARGNMAVRELIIFKHDSELGNCQPHKLFDLIKVQKKPEVGAPRSFHDYTVEVDVDNLPEHVSCIRHN